MNEFRKVGVSGGLDVKGLKGSLIKGSLKVLGKLIKGFLFGINSGIRHLVVPYFEEINSLTLTHLVQGGYDFDLRWNRVWN